MKYIFLSLILLSGCAKVETVVLPESELEGYPSAYVQAYATSIFSGMGYYSVILDSELNMTVGERVYVYWADGQLTGVQTITHKTNNRHYEIDIPFTGFPIGTTSRITKITH